MRQVRVTIRDNFAVVFFLKLHVPKVCLLGKILKAKVSKILFIVVVAILVHV